MADYLIKGPITTEIISSRLAGLGMRKETGGHSIFLGQVRADIVNGKEVRAIEYSAYPQMVETEAGKIINEIFGEFDDVISAEILHSEGVVKAGEISLFVMVSAGHRDHATKACRRLVELLKARLPVWKKELFNDDTHRWNVNG